MLGYKCVTHVEELPLIFQSPSMVVCERGNCSWRKGWKINHPPCFLFYRGIRLFQSCDGKKLCLISEEFSNFSFGVIYGSLAVFVTRVFIHSIFQETSHHLLAVHTSCNN